MIRDHSYHRAAEQLLLIQAEYDRVAPEHSLPPREVNFGAWSEMSDAPTLLHAVASLIDQGILS